MPMRPATTLSSRDVDDGEKYLIQQHAEDVTDFSSQYGSIDSISYTAQNLTGSSRVFPAYGDHAEAFSMRTYGKWWDEAPSGRKDIIGQPCNRIKSQDFVDISFEHKVYPKAITLFEVYNPGSLVRIWAKDTNSKWHLLYEADSLETPSLESRKFQPTLNDCKIITKFLRLEFNHEKRDSYYEVESVILEGYTRQSNSLSPNKLMGDLTKKILNLDLNTLLSSSESSTSSSCSTPTLSESEEEYELNYFDILPYEVVLKIFTYLDLKALCQSSCVNKLFASISKDYSLYSELNLKNVWPIISEGTLHSLSFRCNRLTALDLSWSTGKKDFELPFIKFVSKCGSSLKILRLNCCKFITKYCLSEIADTCHQLEELSLRKILQPYQSLAGWHVLSELTSLKYLDLYHVSINTNELMSFLPYLTKLEHLNLGSCAASRLTMLNMDVIAECLSKHNRHLKSVDMWRSHLSLTTMGIKFLSKCSELQEVDLGWVEIEVLGDCIQELARGCPQLKKLFVPAMRGLTDRDVLTLIHHCPLLEQVDFLGIRNITPEACQRLLAQCPYLHLLDVSYCDKISRAHAALWRVQFPHVSIKQCSYSRPDSIENFI